MSDACWCDDLRARRHDRVRPRLGPRARGAVAQREDVRVDGRLQRLRDHDLVGAVGREAEPRQPARRADAGGPDDEVGRVATAARRLHRIVGDLDDLLVDVHGDVELLQELGRRGGDPLGQRREDALRRLEDRDPDVVHRVEVVEPVGRVRARGLAGSRPRARRRSRPRR
jgi:hypothetical protein